MMACRSSRIRGSATVELLVVVPFVLALTGLVWDLREFVGYRTDLAREMYSVAEVIANETDADPIEAVIEQAMERFERRSSGSIAVAVVTRGTERGLGMPCVDDEAWCLPRVAVAWPPTPLEGRWNESDRCDAPNPLGELTLPLPGQHFEADQRVLPNENPDGAESQEDWISRNMRPTEWWVVVDSCFHPNPGLFAGRLVNLGVDLFDVSGFVLRKRAAWGSVHDLADCVWCT